MASAFFAVLALTRWRLFIHANMLRTGSNPHRIGLPKTGPLHRCLIHRWIAAAARQSMVCVRPMPPTLAANKRSPGRERLFARRSPGRRAEVTSRSGGDQNVSCAGCGRLGTRRAVACCSPCGGSADVDRPLLGYRLSGSLWLGGQLKNRSLLTLTD